MYSIISDENLCDAKSSKFCDWTQDIEQPLVWVKRSGKSDESERTGPQRGRPGSESGTRLIQCTLFFKRFLYKNIFLQRNNRIYQRSWCLFIS